ncbi:MAG TPA: AraC family transcriptional regulator [Thermoanaerobaculia bacterium]
MNVPLAVEESIFSSRLVRLGEHHCPDGTSVAVTEHTVIFPLASGRIVHDGVAAFELPTTVTLQNAGEVVSREGSHHAWMTADASLLSEIVGGDAQHPFPTDHIALEASVSIRQRALFHFARRFGAADPLTVEGESIAIIEQIAAKIRSPRRTAFPCPVVERARALLASQFATTISLAELAQQVGVSSAYLSRAFRAVTGETLHAFREDLRLRRSLDLLPDSRGDFTRVALELGYSSHSHFTSRFRRHFGITPTEFVERTYGAGFRGAAEITRRTAADDGRYVCT